MFEYFKGQIVNNGIIFLWETHSSEETFNKWRDDIKRDVFFSHSITSSCSVMIGYFDNKMFSINKICKDNNGRVLINEADILNRQINRNVYLIKSQ